MAKRTDRNEGGKLACEFLNRQKPEIWIHIKDLRVIAKALMERSE